MDPIVEHALARYYGPVFPAEGLTMQVALKLEDKVRSQSNDREKWSIGETFLKLISTRNYQGN